MAAKAAGTSHVRLGTPCQDRFACIEPAAGWFAAAVADGAGSASHAEDGAEAAVNAALAHLQGALSTGAAPETAVREAVSAARDAVFSAAEALDLEPRDLASTLLVCLAGPGDGAAAQIGDGLIAWCGPDEESEWRWVFWPQRGEHFNVTRFLVDADALDAVQVEPLSGNVTEIALMSDGLEPLALHYASQTLHRPFFETLAKPLRAFKSEGLDERLSKMLDQLLTSARIGERTDDDVTLVLATRREEP